MSNSDTQDKVISMRVFMPETLKNKFKGICAMEGRNMSEVVTEFVEGYVAQHEKTTAKKGKGAA